MYASRSEPTCGTPIPGCALGSKSRRPSPDLEGAPSFASFAMGGLLRSNATNSLLLVCHPDRSGRLFLPRRIMARRPRSGRTVPTNTPHPSSMESPQLSCLPLSVRRYLLSLRLLCSTIKHESSTTTNPPARAFSAAPTFSIPNCIHKTFAPILIADSATAGTSSALRNTSTISTGSGTSSNRAYAFSPKTSVSFGFTGIIRYPAAFKYSATPCEARIGFDDNPTTAIVFASRKTCATASPPAIYCSGKCRFMPLR
jgi:hypothetical protein